MISPNFVPKGPINNIAALVQIMVNSLTYIDLCVTQPQLVNYSHGSSEVTLEDNGKSMGTWPQQNTTNCKSLV